MKTEVYLKLKPFEDKLRSALHSNFVRFTRPEMDAFSEVVKEHRGTGFTPSERTCPHCMLTAVKTIATEYYKFKESPVGKKIEKQNSENIEKNEIKDAEEERHGSNAGEQ